MPTFELYCPNCEHRFETPIQTTYTKAKDIAAGACPECGGDGLSIVPLGGTGFQLKARDRQGKVGRSTSTWSSRGRCLGKEL